MNSIMKLKLKLKYWIDFGRNLSEKFALSYECLFIIKLFEAIVIIMGTKIKNKVSNKIN